MDFSLFKTLLRLLILSLIKPRKANSELFMFSICIWGNLTSATETVIKSVLAAKSKEEAAAIIHNWSVELNK